MIIGVHGLWHLGIVTCAGLLKLGYQVVAYDRNSKVIDDLENLKLPVNEPGISEILQKHRERIEFTNDLENLKSCKIHWITYDTPVNEVDEAEPEAVIEEILKWYESSNFEGEIIISSQLPIGSTERIRNKIDELNPKNKTHLNIQPENLRLGKGLETFLNPDRVVIGVESGLISPIIEDIFSKLGKPVIYMKVESAEMVKHALNAFLATSITFMGEIAQICEATGANAHEVKLGLKSDVRIGDKSYLNPGLGFAGGTLARDIQYLTEIQQHLRPNSLLASLLPNNVQNNDWIYNQIRKVFPRGREIRILLLGITYTSGTNTLRRSSAVELAKKLKQDSGDIFYFDEEDIQVPSDINQILSEISDPMNLYGIDALVIGKKLKIFDDVEFLHQINSEIPYIFDPAGLLKNQIELDVFGNRYFMVGVNNDKR